MMINRVRRPHIWAAAILVGLALSPTASYAVVCPVDTACNGNEYTAQAKNVGGNTWQLTIAINVLDSYTGNKWTDRLSAVGIKDMAPSISNASLVSAPGGGDPFSFYTGELNNGGAICANDTTPGTKLCAWAGADKGVGFTSGDVLEFVFQFDAVELNRTVHIKYLYIDTDGKKVGSLGSFDILVPTPTTLALFGLGLIGFGFASRRLAG